MCEEWGRARQPGEEDTQVCAQAGVAGHQGLG